MRPGAPPKKVKRDINAPRMAIESKALLSRRGAVVT